jgi:methyltransferase (TIGR00027 family)
MTRTDDDTWDLASSVGATATGAAAARAQASRGPDALIHDPFALPLVEAVGIDVLIKSARSESNAADSDARHTRVADFVGTRTKFFDEFLLDATAEGILQVVILAVGLDARAYRLPWPAGTVVYEIDQPQVIEFKTGVLSNLGAHPIAEHRPIGMDLRHDWPTPLRLAGFDKDRPAVWLAEGLLGYLPPEAQDRLLDNITELSAEGSRLGTEETATGGERDQAGIRQRIQSMPGPLSEHGYDQDVSELMYFGDRNEAGAYLNANGWEAVGRSTNELLSRYGLAPLREPMPWGDLVHITATRNEATGSNLR